MHDAFTGSSPRGGFFVIFLLVLFAAYSVNMNLVVVANVANR